LSSKLGIILIPHYRLIALQEREQPAAAQFRTRRFDQKRTPAPRPNHRIDLFKEVGRYNDMCSL
jgi:hypothetical protein